MILVDSSVWIDYFNGVITPEADRLDGLLGATPVAVGDYIVLEVLQGFRSEVDFATAVRLFGSLETFQLLDPVLAVQGAANYRALRRAGITIRKSIDVVIATFCIENGHSLLFSDRDFVPFVEHLGLTSAA